MTEPSIEFLRGLDMKVTPIEQGYTYRFLRMQRELNEAIAKAFTIPAHLLDPTRRPPRT